MVGGAKTEKETFLSAIKYQYKTYSLSQGVFTNETKDHLLPPIECVLPPKKLAIEKRR